MTDEPTVWYRYEDSSAEWTRDPYELTLRVIRYTTKCVVLNWYGMPKTVLLQARKRFAYPTRELAMGSYIARKEWEIRITQARHDRAVENLAAAEAMRDRGFVRERTASPSLDLLFKSDGGPCPPVVLS